MINYIIQEKSLAPRGRPRNFDRNAALEKALNVFWTKGYDLTQVADLTDTLGINPPSFYAAFSTKEALFREALQHYIAHIGVPFPGVLEDVPDIRDALRNLLQASAKVALQSPSGGCMLIFGSAHKTADNAAIYDVLHDLRIQTHEAIRARLQRAADEGALPPHCSVDQLTHFFGTVLQGLSVRAHDGATQQDLNDAIIMALHCFDAMTTVRKP